MATAGERPLFIRLSLPAGLEESLEGLAREVLRSQPKNLYKFAADHFEAKLKNRNRKYPVLLDEPLCKTTPYSIGIHNSPDIKTKKMR